MKDSKINEHLAVIPTKAFPAVDSGVLSIGERDLLYLATVRLIATIAPKNKYKAVTVTLECAGYHFTVNRN